MADRCRPGHVPVGRCEGCDAAAAEFRAQVAELAQLLGIRGLIVLHFGCKQAGAFSLTSDQTLRRELIPLGQEINALCQARLAQNPAEGTVGHG